MAIWIGIMMGWRVTGIRRNEKGRSARPYQLVSIGLGAIAPDGLDIRCRLGG